MKRPAVAQVALSRDLWDIAPVETRHVNDLVREAIGRTRAVIAESHASIGRSDDRVRDSLRMLMRWRTRFDAAAAAGLRFELHAPVLSDEQLVEAFARWQAMVEQHQVTLEMRHTHALAEALPAIPESST